MLSTLLNLASLHVITSLERDVDPLAFVQHQLGLLQLLRCGSYLLMVLLIVNKHSSDTC
jgi:hypothetical protein